MKNISTALLLCIAITPAFAISVCEADFTVETSGLTITVADASAAGAGDSILAWYYTIDGGISVNTPGFTYTFDSPGWHVICLMIETAGDCTDEKCEEVFIGADSTDCFVDFDYFTDGLTAEFVAETDPEEYLEITWYFGDGSTSTAPLPLHIYGAEGTYEVCVSVLFADSCSASVCYPVVIDTGEADCTASLEVWSADGLDIHFFGWVEPESDEVTYYFDYGDGISEVIEGGDSGADPWHSYAGEGMYVVCLSIETESGCTDTTCIELFVNDSTAMDCSASFDFETVGSIVFFESTTTPGPGDVESYFWEFGDGATADGANPDHAYEPGVYLACLTVTFASGCTAEYCAEISIGDTGVICESFFTITSIIPEAGGWMVYFNNASVVVGGDIGTTFWDFGDGTVSDSFDAEHLFTADSAYAVCLTITSADSACTDTYCFELSLGDVGSGDCEAYFEYEIAGTAVNFISTSDADSDIIAWGWDFGDGDYGFGEEVTHTFEAGIYAVCLAIITADSCVDTYCTSVAIGDSATACEAHFEFEGFTPAEDGWVAIFSNTSGGDFDLTHWEFGDGGESFGMDADHLYTAEGFYTVCLTIGAAGTDCYDTYCADIFIGDCIDESLIDSAYGCTEEYDPVCGCDGVTYANACHATYYGGVLSWLPGECEVSIIPPAADKCTLSVIPNPAHYMFNVSLTLVEAQWMDIALADINGRIIQNLFVGTLPAGTQSIAAIVGDLPSGIYVLKINTRNIVRTEKILILN